jgi:hypothetical protein
MKAILLLPFIFILSCTTPDLQVPTAAADTVYLITDYDSRGKIENTYTVKDYDVGSGDVVRFNVDNKPKSVVGSFKIEKISKN